MDGYVSDPRSKDAALHLDLMALLAKATYRASDPPGDTWYVWYSWCLGRRIWENKEPLEFFICINWIQKNAEFWSSIPSKLR